MKILITGATGFVGRSLAQVLVKEGYKLVILSRDAARAQKGLPVAGQYQEWDGRTLLATHILKGVDGVINLAGENVGKGRWTAKKKKAIYDSRILGTRALVDSMIASKEGRPRFLINASAVGYYGSRGEEQLDEDASAGTGFLAEVAHDWEQEAVKLAGHGVRVVLMRTGMVVGDGGALKAMLCPFKMGAGGIVGSGRQCVSWVHLDDLVRLYLHAVRHDCVTGPVNGTAPVCVTNRELTKTLARLVKRPSIVKMPKRAVRVIFGKKAEILLSSQRVYPRNALESGFEFEYETFEGALKDALKKIRNVPRKKAGRRAE